MFFLGCALHSLILNLSSKPANMEWLPKSRTLKWPPLQLLFQLATTGTFQFMFQLSLVSFLEEKSAISISNFSFRDFFINFSFLRSVSFFRNYSFQRSAILSALHCSKSTISEVLIPEIRDFLPEFFIPKIFDFVPELFIPKICDFSPNFSYYRSAIFFAAFLIPGLDSQSPHLTLSIFCSSMPQQRQTNRCWNRIQRQSSRKSS